MMTAAAEYYLVRPAMCRFLLQRLILTTFVFAFARSVEAQVTDDFSDGRDEGWTQYNPFIIDGRPGTFSFPNGGYRIQVPTSHSEFQYGLARAASFRLDSVLSDFTVSVDITNWDASLNQGLGVAARVREIGLGTLDGYGLVFFPNVAPNIGPGIGGLAIVRYDDEIREGIHLENLGGFGVNTTTDYRLIFTGVGAILTGAIYDIRDLEVPVATLQAVDSTYINGVTGVTAATTYPWGPGDERNVDVTFDNFSSSVPEPSTTILVCGALVSFVARRRRNAVVG